jgi:hypothetical protein
LETILLISSDILTDFRYVLQEEEEEEEEEEVVNESAKKKKYARDGENPQPWLVRSLSVPKKGSQINYAAQGASDKNPKNRRLNPGKSILYPATQFSVKNYTFSKASIS